MYIRQLPLPKKPLIKRLIPLVVWGLILFGVLKALMWVNVIPNSYKIITQDKIDEVLFGEGVNKKTPNLLKLLSTQTKPYTLPDADKVFWNNPEGVNTAKLVKEKDPLYLLQDNATTMSGEEFLSRVGNNYLENLPFEDIDNDNISDYFVSIYKNIPNLTVLGFQEISNEEAPLRYAVMVPDVNVPLINLKEDERIISMFYNGSRAYFVTYNEDSKEESINIYTVADTSKYEYVERAVVFGTLPVIFAGNNNYYLYSPEKDEVVFVTANGSTYTTYENVSILNGKDKMFLFSYDGYEFAFLNAKTGNIHINRSGMSQSVIKTNDIFLDPKDNITYLRFCNTDFYACIEWIDKDNKVTYQAHLGKQDNGFIDAPVLKVLPDNNIKAYVAETTGFKEKITVSQKKVWIFNLYEISVGNEKKVLLKL